MSAERRLYDFFQLASASARSLVTGYHAARFYGAAKLEAVDHTLYVDIDADGFAALAKQVKAPAPAAGAGEVRWSSGDESYRVLRESPSLPAFATAWRRRSSGRYADHNLEFLGLDDLLLSFETGNDADWRVLAELEQLADDRRLDACEDPDNIGRALANMRSAHGFERARSRGYYQNAEAVAEASQSAKHPVSLAFLLPFQAQKAVGEELPLAPTVRALLDGPLRDAEAGGVSQLGLVEAVRRAYKLSKA